jgi:peptidylprolyl isomerase
MRQIFRSLIVASSLVIASGAVVASSSSAAVIPAPTVKGGFNHAPTISFPSSAPPTTLQVSFLHRGSGPKVTAGELLIGNYVGQIWRGKVFDNSFSRKQLSSFPIGVGVVLPGWDKGLIGAPLGSRVLLVIPPADGYGSAGDSQAGITAKDTLVFVIDLVAAHGKNYFAQSNPKILHSSVDGITIKENGAKQPSVAIAKGAAQPTSVKFTELASGSGKKILPGLVVMQLLQLSWTGTLVASTWVLGSPFGANLAQHGQPGIFDQLVGMNLGSRIMVELPKTSSTGGPFVVIAEVVSEPVDGAT